MYLLAPFQAWHSEPSYLTARLTILALALGGIAASWWLGRRSYGPVAGFVAAAAVAVETTYVAYSRMAVTDVPLTLGVAVAPRAHGLGPVRARRARRRARGEREVPGRVPAGPARRRRPGGDGGGSRSRAAWPRSPSPLTSPFVVHPLREAVGDAWRVQQDARQGWLGFENDHAAPIAFAARLWDGFGPALLIAVAGLVVAFVRRTRADLVLGTFVVVYFADLMTLHAHFDRYLLPLVPALGALAGRLRSLAPVTLLLLVIPFTWDVRDARDLTRTDARVVAHGWARAASPARGATSPRTRRRPTSKAFASSGWRFRVPGSPPTRTGTSRACAGSGSTTSSSPGRSKTGFWPLEPTIRARPGSTRACRSRSASTRSGRTVTLAGHGSRFTGYNVLMLRLAGAGILVALALTASACSSDEQQAWPPRRSRRLRPAPRAGRAPGIASRCGSARPVYCPTWMPNPLDGEIGGQWDNGVSVEKDSSYLVSFLWHEPPSQDVHVNFRGFPGRTKIPRCEDVEVVAGKAHKTYSPCFSDANGKRRFGPITATLYTVNRGVDQWHILYAWQDHGSLYAVSEHVAKPLTFQQVRRNLDRVMRGLVRVSP